MTYPIFSENLTLTKKILLERILYNFVAYGYSQEWFEKQLREHQIEPNEHDYLMVMQYQQNFENKLSFDYEFQG